MYQKESDSKILEDRKNTRERKINRYNVLLNMAHFLDPSISFPGNQSAYSAVRHNVI